MTRFRKSLVSLAAIAVLAGCGATSGRYLIDTPAPTQQVRVPLSTIEVRDVTLPDYVSSAEIMVQSEDGALRPVANAIWADNPVRGFTLMLARNLDTGSNAAAMTEPWPLTEPPHARVEVRVEQMVAQIDGTFRLTGQFAIGSPDLVVRERISRFDIIQPISGTGAGAIADATGRALQTLSMQILRRMGG